MNYHDTNSSIWDLPCKSQSCASLGKFSANVVSNKNKEKIHHSYDILLKIWNYEKFNKELPENNLRILFRVNMIKSVDSATDLCRLFGGIS